uniref:hypothetical protein n=1 Tax=Pseudohongiella nitratireducens TaxID=1768907 RepID=UPI00294FFC50
AFALRCAVNYAYFVHDRCPLKNKWTLSNQTHVNSRCDGRTDTKRRGFTKKLLCERTGFDHKTVNKVFAGDPGVAIGTYLKVMAVLGMESNFAEMAAHDEVVIKLQNIKLLEGSK